MGGLILLLHVISGIVAVLSSITFSMSKFSIMKKMFWPAIISVSFSGIILIFVGSSLARVCISGILMTASLLIIKKYSTSKMRTASIKS